MTTASTLSLNDIQALPAVLDVPTAGRLLGLGRAAAYELVRRGDFPAPVLRLGRQLRVPTVPLLQLLGVGSAAPLPKDLVS
jgi:predicted DNA-binding transcriptional regulator AlpA